MGKVTNRKKQNKEMIHQTVQIILKDKERYQHAEFEHKITEVNIFHNIVTELYSNKIIQPQQTPQNVHKVPGMLPPRPQRKTQKT